MNNTINDGASQRNVKGGNCEPFIQLLRTPRKFYFFDVNRNKLCNIEESVYNRLNARLTCRTDIPVHDAIDDEIEALKNDGWLSTNRPTYLLHPSTDKVEIFAHNDLSTLVLQVTQACNLCCIYCPYALNTSNELSRSHSSKTMSFETAKKSINFLATNSSNSEDIYISFYGGEPLIAFPLVKKCVEYANEVFDGKRVQYLLTTNATLLSDEMLDYFALHRFALTFSLDGPKAIHDKHRIRADGSPTYELVMDTLQKTIDRYGEEAKGLLLVNMVINPADSFDEILEWLNNDTMRNIMVQATLVEDYYIERKFSVTSDFTEKLRYNLALSILNYLDAVTGLNTNPITDAMVTKNAEAFSKLQEGGGELSDVACPGGPCMSGITKLFVNADGTFFPCEKVNELATSMMIGDVENGFDFEQIRKHLNISQLTSEKCKNCWAQTHCGICQRQADGGDELSGASKLKFCNQVQADLMAMLRTCTLFQEYRTIYKDTARDER